MSTKKEDFEAMELVMLGAAAKGGFSKEMESAAVKIREAMKAIEDEARANDKLVEPVAGKEDQPHLCGFVAALALAVIEMSIRVEEGDFQ